MYWDGKKEVTKERVREILTEEFKKNNVQEFWTTHPEDLENVQHYPDMVAVSENEWDPSVCDACFTLEDEDLFNGIFRDTGDGKLRVFKNMYNKLTLVYKDGEWLDAK